MAIMRIRRPELLVAGGPAGVAAAGDAPSTPAAASSDSGSEPDVIVVVIALILVLAVWALAFWLNPFQLQLAQPATLATGVSVFALLYIAAQALERLLEPLSALDRSKKTAEATRDTAVASALAKPSQDALLLAAANAQAALERIRKNRAVIFWGLATIGGMVMSALSGIYILDIVIDQPTPPQSVDILVTGLVVGGGTKPLHDLIARLESAKDNAQDPPETKPST